MLGLGLIAGAGAEAKLRDALVEVQRLKEELATIQRDISAQTDTQRFSDYVDACSSRFARDKTFANERELILAQVVRDRALDRIRPILMARRYSDGTEPLVELFRRNSGWRDTLKQACEGKLALAEQEYEKVCGTVRDQLGNGFDSLDLENEPRVKRARREVEMWRGLLTQCSSEKDAPALWGRVTRNLEG
jgi:hypothetical protein